MDLFLGIGPPFVDPCVFPSWLALGFTLRRGHRHSDQRPSRSAVYFPSQGRARWVGERRWALSRRRQSSGKVSFYFPLVFFWGGESFTPFFKGMVLFISVLLSMLVAQWEPIPCYRDAHSVGTPKWASWRQGWVTHYKTTFSPFSGRLFLFDKQKDLFLFWEVTTWMFHRGRARHPGPGPRSFTPGQLSIEFVNVGGWLTSGDLALDSCAQFLAIAEHKLIPSRARSVCHQLRGASHHSVWAPACQDQVAGGHAGVGVVSLGGAPLSLPSFVTPQFQECVQVGSCKLLQAVLAEAQVVCIGQPMLTAGDLNADPAVIPCLAEGISAGRYVDLALAYSLGAGLTPGGGISLSAVPVLLLHLMLVMSLIGGSLLTLQFFLTFALVAGWLTLLARLHVSLCGLLVGWTLLMGPPRRPLVLSKMSGMFLGMSLGWFLRKLFLLLGMLPLGLLLTIFGLFGVVMLRRDCFGLILQLGVLLMLAALPFLVEVSNVFVAGVWEAELLVARARAGYIVLARVMRLTSIVLNSLSTPLFLPCYSFVGVLSPLLMFLKVSRARDSLRLGGMLS